MVNFTDSFKIGIDAAEKAELAKKEILKVLDELKKQILEATEQKIIVRLEEISPSDTHLSFPGKESFSTKTRTYSALIASGSSSNRYKELARWTESKTGYPCIISFENKEIHCEDKEGLENGLSELLQDPVVGRHLSQLMQSPA